MTNKIDAHAEDIIIRFASICLLSAQIVTVTESNTDTKKHYKKCAGQGFSLQA